MKPQSQSSGNAAAPSSKAPATAFHSVEFALDQPNMLYQFKIWNSESDPMFMVVREDSAVIESLHTGHVCDMKFYSNDKKRPTACYRARIDRMTKDREGRFRDHWRVALEILDGEYNAQLN
ncbi:MAG: hypothetical protein QNJ22_10850 [Desulfosarcinaceae bacterium]|nr:hypothetical protein [Desulfosarcinaceae bacterium]